MTNPTSGTRTVHFSVDLDASRAVVTICGTLNTAAALAAGESLTLVGDRRQRCVTLNLSDVEHVLPRAIHVLEAEVARIRESGISVRVQAKSGTRAHDILSAESRLLS